MQTMWRIGTGAAGFRSATPAVGHGDRRPSTLRANGQWLLGVVRPPGGLPVSAWSCGSTVDPPVACVTPLREWLRVVNRRSRDSQF
jgi:hypothetical protein